MHDFVHARTNFSYAWRPAPWNKGNKHSQSSAATPHEEMPMHPGAQQLAATKQISTQTRQDDNETCMAEHGSNKNTQMKQENDTHVKLQKTIEAHCHMTYQFTTHRPHE
jgi:hypothetical protein